MRKKYVIMGLVILVLCFIGMPIFIDRIIIGNGFKSNVSNEQWFQFLGTYIGSAIGAVIAVAGALFVMNETNKANHKMQEMEVRRGISQKIIDLAIQYSTEIRNCYIKHNENDQIKKEISEIEEKRYPVEIKDEMQLNILKSSIKDIDETRSTILSTTLAMYLNMTNSFPESQNILDKIIVAYNIKEKDKTFFSTLTITLVTKIQKEIKLYLGE